MKRHASLVGIAALLATPLAGQSVNFNAGVQNRMLANGLDAVPETFIPYGASATTKDMDAKGVAFNLTGGMWTGMRAKDSSISEHDWYGALTANTTIGPVDVAGEVAYWDINATNPRHTEPLEIREVVGKLRVSFGPAGITFRHTNNWEGGTGQIASVDIDASGSRRFERLGEISFGGSAGLIHNNEYFQPEEGMASGSIGGYVKKALGSVSLSAHLLRQWGMNDINPTTWHYGMGVSVDISRD